MKTLTILCVLAVPVGAAAIALGGSTPPEGVLAPAEYVVEEAVTIPPDPPPIDTPATAAVTPTRGSAVQVTETIPPPPKPTAREIVNGLPYKHYDAKPALEAFRLVAADVGWSSQLIAAWEPFVNDVMFGESAYCWNRRNGDVVAMYSACVIIKATTREDVGFGQATRSLYGPDAQLCKGWGICSAEQILASPYDSMLWSIVRPIELNGSQPWCYNDAARAYHKCHLAPDR